MKFNPNYQKPHNLIIRNMIIQKQLRITLGAACLKPELGEEAHVLTRS